MTQDKHSPLPFYWGSNGLQAANHYFVIWPDNVPLDAKTWTERLGACGETSEEFAQANAAFIVRAVNNHYQLIEALEVMINAYGNKPKMSIDAAEKIGLKALSNAKGGDDE